ncbi:protein phosphatase 1 regulatory subunit 1B-like isoform X2 [Genypterus blacodes]|uniref:protein phosphatase 1 regulatory subunit 1B-like isoform X2 n=1 Tax=Genypterus blacodes TaxID=154954 RepID=UPI003F776E06
MDPLLPAETEVTERETAKEESRRIQFSVPPPSAPIQLDPRQVEMIRRRRPTPATLFRTTDLPSPDEDSSNPQWVLGDNGALKAKLVNMSVYQPPSLKVVQRMAQAHLPYSGVGSVENEEEESTWTSSERRPHQPTRAVRFTGSADLSRRHRDEEEPKEREESKGE